jgi:tRNA pseudouridine13 synthase
VFNAVLEQRPLAIDAIEPGDIAMRHDSGGSFLVEDVLAEAPRVASFEISPTGPIFGNKVLQPEGAPAERERAVLKAHGIDPDSLPRVPGIRLRGSRRALRMRPGEPALEREGTSTRLCFTLPPGSYATVVLEELLGRAPSEGE